MLALIRNDWLYLILISMSPVVECRGSIPFGLSQGLPLSWVFVVAFLSNALMGIVVYEVFGSLKKHLLAVERVKSWYEAHIERSLRRFKKYEWGLAVSLALFIGIPLPGTGAFTGALLADALDLSRTEAWSAITAGVLTAAVVVSALSWSAIQIAR
ncbi:small multi-drug export protein [Coprothermobacteraceae bacterium]|nr:small multi-drug export protein [Coprothermobacteraceae bacterium]